MLDIRNRTFKVKYLGNGYLEGFDRIISVFEIDSIYDAYFCLDKYGYISDDVITVIKNDSSHIRIDRIDFEILDFEEYNKIIFNIIEDIEKLKNIRKVKCISLEYNNTIYARNDKIKIRKGGIYDVLEFLPTVAPQGRFRLSIDNKIYPIQLFTPISDWRKEQLNKILK
jgi:hypothetical protein